MINNLGHYEWIIYGSLDYYAFNEYILRQNKFKKYINIDMFKTLCRVTFIIGEPMKNWIYNFY